MIPKCLIDYIFDFLGSIDLLNIRCINIYYRNHYHNIFSKELSYCNSMCYFSNNCMLKKKILWDLNVVWKEYNRFLQEYTLFMIRETIAKKSFPHNWEDKVFIYFRLWTLSHLKRIFDSGYLGKLTLLNIFGVEIDTSDINEIQYSLEYFISSIANVKIGNNVINIKSFCQVILQKKISDYQKLKMFILLLLRVLRSHLNSYTDLKTLTTLLPLIKDQPGFINPPQYIYCVGKNYLGKCCGNKISFETFHKTGRWYCRFHTFQGLIHPSIL